ncbi:MAG: hypothetical protein JWN61_1084 [Pseudonocardiales bacterium]|nr:hypothetical protein [Pseudonocardiales bacterium]
MGSDLPTITVILLAAAGLILTMRWVFAPSRPRPKGRARPAANGDFGLLEPLVLALSRSSANALRATLGDAGIRSSLSARRDGRADVLVFRTDLDRARALLPPGLGS